ncbi:hypothetical protein H0H87_009485 [Tephrocybe sp. NHM501043]|nr:hypothetical protein H0H87_009485 [Tephrocybe sp. NHM501043]
MREWHDAITESSRVLSSPAYSSDRKLGHEVAPPPARSHTKRPLKDSHQGQFRSRSLFGQYESLTDDLQHANPKTVGYVTSGYWGGFALARLIWGLYVPR